MKQTTTTLECSVATRDAIKLYCIVNKIRMKDFVDGLVEKKLSTFSKNLKKYPIKN